MDCTSALRAQEPTSLDDTAKLAPAASLSTGLIFALTAFRILVASSALQEWFGQTDIIVAAALAGAGGGPNRLIICSER
jgi:uncharacterized membrane protein (DUF4010 family)